jgi:hypothetical protein
MTAADRLHALTVAALELAGVAERIESLRPTMQKVSINIDTSVVDVAIVPRDPDDRGPVVDVALVPVDSSSSSVRLTKSAILNLPTLAQLQAVRRATRKDQLETRLDRAIAHKAVRLEDAKQLRIWATAVKDRDHWKDRKTGRRVHSTRTLDPDRAEAHHIESKDDHAVRYDVRNGLCLSFASHEAVTHGVYRIEGTVFFTVNGSRYIDGTHPVNFVRN